MYITTRNIGVAKQKLAVVPHPPLAGSTGLVWPERTSCATKDHLPLA